MATLYPKVILQHCARPLNRGRLKKPAKKFTGQNYFCGDYLEFYIRLGVGKKITAVAWQGGGCAIMQASASIFSEMIKGKTLAQVQKMPSRSLLKRLNLTVSPIRLTCALLPLYTIKAALPLADSTS